MRYYRRKKIPNSKDIFITFLILFFKSSVYAKIIPIYPDMQVSAINQQLNSANPGDTLLFYPGIYKGPFVLEDVNGDLNNPIVIMGKMDRRKKLVTVDGKAQPGMNLENFAFHLENSSNVSIENFIIRNCWTDLIRAENVSYLSVRNCDMKGGKRAVFAEGRDSHHFLVENCSWEQDERVWTQTGDYTWDEIHHGIHQHYNGSIFQGSGISGVFVIRDNHIKNTFNAFRLSLINDNTLDLLACTNGEIYRNTIINTSDNVLEPEVHTLNLHYYHNHMINGHAFISVTEVAGGYIYLYGNTAVSLPDCEDGWSVFKFSSLTRNLSKPFYIFNNSWYVDYDIIGSIRNVRKLNHIRHFNNACFTENADSFGIYNIGEDNWFDYDCSNVKWPKLFTESDQQQHGIVADPLFKNPFENDFRLESNSPCIDKGLYYKDFIRNARGKGPDIGAYEGDQLVEGPPFRYMEPEIAVPFEENPRITKHHLDGKKLSLWFSGPLRNIGLKNIQFTIKAGNDKFDMKFKELTEEGYCMILELPEIIRNNDYKMAVSDWPLGLNGREMTSWASTIEIFRNRIDD